MDQTKLENLLDKVNPDTWIKIFSHIDQTKPEWELNKITKEEILKMFFDKKMTN